MFGYGNALRSLTGGNGRFELSFSHYEVLPREGGPDDTFPPAMALRA